MSQRERIGHQYQGLARGGRFMVEGLWRGGNGAEEGRKGRRVSEEGIEASQPG